MDEIKNIVATFVKKDPSEIGPDTLINKRVISGSILVHRMYAALGNAGHPIKDYNDINTFGELLSKLNGVSKDTASHTPAQPQSYSSNIHTSSKSVGIDIESVNNFPQVSDFREDHFYKANFTMQEISYCILKSNPLESFAGLFSVKEALCKANEAIRKMPFNIIEIEHDTNGRPVFPGYAISIAHNGQYAVAVAVANEGSKPPSPESGQLNVSSTNQDAKIASLKRWVVLIGLVAIIAAIISISVLLRIP